VWRGGEGEDEGRGGNSILPLLLEFDVETVPLLIFREDGRVIIDKTLVSNVRDCLSVQEVEKVLWGYCAIKGEYILLSNNI